MTTKRFYRRRFLNRRGFHGGAYVLADCELETYRPTGQPVRHNVEAQFTVADCGPGRDPRLQREQPGLRTQRGAQGAPAS
jgi:hypothetical protein